MKRFFSKIKNFTTSLRKSKKKPISFSKWGYPFALIFIIVFLCFKSFTQQTFLTGWDTLHPEFNLKHAFESVIWGVYRPDQGLGALSIHSHMSELPRLLFLSLASHVAPLNSLRYLYFFVCLLLGPLGMYVFLQSMQKRNVSAASFMGSLYYILNLGLVQRMWVPFEMFAASFACVPWIFWAAFSYTKTNNRKYLIALFVASFLGSSQAYAATLFYAFSSLFILSLFIFSLANQGIRKALKKLLIVLLVVFSTNAYWLLPNLYSIRNQSREVSNSKINELFTPEAILHNKSYGDFMDVISQKSYLFNWQVYNFKANQFENLLSSWNTHLSNKWVEQIPVLFAVIAFFGLGFVLFQKNKLGISFLIPCAFSLFFLMNSNGPLSGVYTYLQEHSGLIKEGFRDPFTKFSIMFSFFLSFYISFFFETLYGWIKKLTITYLLFAGALIFLFKPAFEYGLISPALKVSVPQEYFQMFDFFKGKEGRIAQLPLNSLWGWQYNSWGYQGAGFIWFGLENPYLTRDFDRWNSQNETFYLQASKAFFDRDMEKFENTISKYDVKYLLLDGSVIDPGVGTSSSKNKEYEDFLSKSKHFKKTATFSFLEIYESDLSNGESVPSVYSEISSNGEYSRVDYNFNQFGNYLEGSNLIRPFSNFDNRVFKITKEAGSSNVSASISPIQGSTLTIPDIVKREEVLAVKVSVKKEKQTLVVRFDLLKPEIFVDNVAISKTPTYMLYEFSLPKNAGKIGVEDAVFDFSSVSEDSLFHDLGQTYISTKVGTNVYLFSKEPVKYKEFLPSIVKKKAVYCSDPSKESTILPHVNGFSIDVSNDSLCIGDVISLPSAALFETRFETPNGDSSFFCINQTGKDGCVNILPPYGESIFGGRKITYRTPLTKGVYWFAFVGQSLGPNTQSRATFDNISLSYFPQLAKVQLYFGQGFSLFSAEKNIEIKDASNITVKFPTPPLISENFILKRGHPTAVNCEANAIGSVSKEMGMDEVTYKAQNGGVSCDYFDYPQLLQSHSYLLTVEGENSEGRGIKFYLQNQSTSHMDFEELLSGSTFTGDYVLESHGGNQGGYVLNFETRSLDSISSVNKIKSISFSVFPLNFLSEITIGKTSEVTKNNKLTVIKENKLGLLRRIEVDGSGILSTNQGYEKGWFAISQSGKVLTHKTLNGWANAWEVDSNTKTVYIIYLPQILEFTGALFLIVTCYKLTKR